MNTRKTKWLTPVAAALAFSCGGGGGDGTAPPADLDQRCSLSGETYDPFFGADGAYCEDPGGGEGSYCFAGDRCTDSGECEYVTSVSAQGSCGLIGAAYDPFFEADGTYCDVPDGSEGSYCLPGDRCGTLGMCEAVLSTIGDPAHAVLFGNKYDPFFGASGAYCEDPIDEDGSYCLPGDRCRIDGYCEVVLQSKASGVDASQIGSMYDPFFEADGAYCPDPTGEEGSYCRAGDLCLADGYCEVVLSARADAS